MDEPRDRLVDLLLREQLGGETPPDLTERILARAFPSRRATYWRVGALAASLLLVVGALSWIAVHVLSTDPYPQPSATGGFEVVGGGPVQRGAVLRTRDQGAQLVLGGYARIELSPLTLIRIEGEPHAEAVLVESGEARCTVERQVGAFSARTPIGTAAVLGTEFTVRVVEEKGAGGKPERWVLVRVAAGTVELTGDWGAAQLTAGTEERFRAVEGQAPEPRGGTLFGTVASKGETFIEVRGDGETAPRRYMPTWIGGAGGGFDKAMLAAINRTPVGSRVKVDWKFEERPRVLRLELVAPPGNAK
ncbi:MAG: FecR domain-containing protein [Planctomycetia bacterium]|nr:FecR domain-containing protein [Planctomycetia bacterium]